MGITMYDSVTAGNIPTDAAVVAGYADGAFEWSEADWARFPHAVKLSIAVNPAHDADVLDVENGDATPADVPGWCDRFNRPGRRRPTIYCNRGAWATVRAAVGARTVDYWIADYTHVPHALDGAVAVQYDDPGPVDLSLITDPSWVGQEASDMTIDVARSIVFVMRTLLLGEPGSQAEVDAYASQMTSGNPEASLTALLSDAARDPRFRLR